MRILTLPTSPHAVPDVVALAAEIGRFNAGIDFRLRFLDVEIDARYAASEAVSRGLSSGLPEAPIALLPDERPLQAAARLAVLLERERPDLLVVVGSGPLAQAAEAAAEASGVPWGRYGADPGDAHATGVELGADAGSAIERITGMAREIR
jgi:hypothetical protein